MTRQRRNAVALAVAGVVAATVAVEVSRDAAGIEGGATRAELRTISSRLDGPHSPILIESSEPVAYVTSQPDPLTVLVDLRNVKAGQLPPGILGPLPPVANVKVEEAGRARRAVARSGRPQRTGRHARPQFAQRVSSKSTARSSSAAQDAPAAPWRRGRLPR